MKCILTDPRFTLKAFVTWLGQQDPDGTYEFADPTKCAYAKYLQSLGFNRSAVGAYDFWLDVKTGPFYDLAPGITGTAVGVVRANVCLKPPTLRTFGEAHKRGLEILGKAA